MSNAIKPIPSSPLGHPAREPQNAVNQKLVASSDRGATQGFAGREERLLETQGCDTSNLRASWASTERRKMVCHSCRSCSRYLGGVCGGVRLDPVFFAIRQNIFGRGAHATPVLPPCDPCARGPCYPRVRVPGLRPTPRVFAVFSPCFPRAALRGPYGDSRQRVITRAPDS